jgi:GT2 family glycosyltransferase
MNIAAIVITYNDGYKFKEWVEHHQTYKDELYKHIIVDNGSASEYLNLVEANFTESFIIKRSSNGGCTGAYNDGIKLALSDPKVDAIMLIGNDMKLENGGVNDLSRFLGSDDCFGMVAPILLSKDSQMIDDFGCEVSRSLYMNAYDVGKNVSDTLVKQRIVGSVTGGMNLARREFYEKVGLQDEKLFMYSDEVDIAIRAEQEGFKMAVTREVKSWHQHINPNNGNNRALYTFYLISRNKMYLARKHFGFNRIIYVLGFLFSRIVFAMAFGLFKRTKWKQQAYFFWGIINGFFGNMKLPEFVINNK